MRRKILQHKKQFVCRCVRCRAPDWSAQVRASWFIARHCPNCSHRRCSNAQVPCPGCHPRTPNGHIPIDDPILFSPEAHRGGASHVHYVRRDAEPEEVTTACPVAGAKEAPAKPGVWRCTHCSRTWSASEVFPTGAAFEEDIEQARACPISVSTANLLASSSHRSRSWFPAPARHLPGASPWVLPRGSRRRKAPSRRRRSHRY